MKAEILTVTPEMAAQWLSKRHPRQMDRYSPVVAAGYAKQMDSGAWDEQHPQGIAISTDGYLLDGQHRLEALLMHGDPVRMLVVMGVDKETYRHIDAQYPRSLAFRAGRDRDHMSVLSTILALARYGGEKVRSTVEDVDACDEFCKHEYDLFVAKVGSRRRLRLNPAALRTAAILRLKVNEAFSDAICDAYLGYLSGDFKSAPRSMSALYRRMTEEYNPSMQTFCLAWKAFDPNGFDNQKIQLNSIPDMIKQLQRGVLRPLVHPERAERLSATAEKTASRPKYDGQTIQRPIR